MVIVYISVSAMVDVAVTKGLLILNKQALVKIESKKTRKVSPLTS